MSTIEDQQKAMDAARWSAFNKSELLLLNRAVRGLRTYWEDGSSGASEDTQRRHRLRQASLLHQIQAELARRFKESA